MKTFHLISLLSLLSFMGCSTSPLSSLSGNNSAPNPSFPYLSQKGISGNACGPVSIVNAFGAGSKDWRSLLTPYPSSRDAVISILRKEGSRPSLSFKNRNRWNKLMGMNLEDLTLTMNELAGEPSFPAVRSYIAISRHKTALLTDLKMVESKIKLSFKNGLPPIANLSRVAHRSSRASYGEKLWDTIGSHSVVISSISPITETTGVPTLSFTYIDPANGQELKGQLSLPEASSDTPKHYLMVSAPQSNIFKSVLSPGTSHHLNLSSLIGAF